MKKIAIVLFVICSLFIGCGNKNAKQESSEDVTALLEIHDFSGKGVITNENSPVRSAPDDADEGNIIGTLERDIPVTITRRKGKQSVVDQTVIFWYEVTDGKIKGWVFGHSVGIEQ